jgi:hypothetical protein
MRMEGLIFLIIGIALCIIGMIYATEWTLVGTWVGGFVMIVVSIAVMFPQTKGASVE